MPDPRPSFTTSKAESRSCSLKLYLRQQPAAESLAQLQLHLDTFGTTTMSDLTARSGQTDPGRSL